MALQKIQDEIKTELRKSGVMELPSSELIDYLFDRGLMNESTVRICLIRQRYYEKLRDNSTSCFDIKIDLSVEFEVSVDFIHSCIYKYTHKNF